MKKVLMMLFIGIIVSSCLNEEEKKIVPEGSYKLPSTVTLGKVRMYTSLLMRRRSRSSCQEYLGRIHNMILWIMQGSFLLIVPHALLVMKIIWI